MDASKKNGKAAGKIRTCLSSLLGIVLIMTCGWLPAAANAGLKKLNETELGRVTGTGPVDFEVFGDTARAYFDVHAEFYAELDSFKMGYYQRENLRTRKFMPPEDPMVIDHGDGTFSVYPDAEQNLPGQIEGVGEPMGPYPFYIYTEADGTTTHKLAYTDNANYQSKYNETLGSGYYVEGLQGENDIVLTSLLGVDHFSSHPTTNQNHMDWDINIENLRFGRSPEAPMTLDGLVIHLKYDDINSPNKELTDIIIGTNCLEGEFFGDFIRLTGYLNPKLPHQARNGTLESIGNFSQVFNKTPVPVSMKRDSFLMLVDHFKAQYFDPEPGEDDKIDHPRPSDPVNNNIHTGMFLRIGLDPQSPHYGFSMIAGYNEMVANAYEPSDVMLEDAVTDWWQR